MLVRDYLRKALYDTVTRGYFVHTSPINYQEGRLVDFRALRNRKEWIRAQTDLYSSHGEGGGGEWLTQCELFAPHFSRVLVDYVVKRSKTLSTPAKLNIIEVGGGSGTNALHFLDGLKLRYPDIYSQTKYTLCEISSTMANIQLGRLSGRHRSVCQVINKDFLTWDTPISEDTIVIAMEVLDNLPHDKIVYKGPESDISSFNFRDKSLFDEVLVESTGVEVTQSLSDPLLLDALNLFHGIPHPSRASDSSPQKGFQFRAKKFASQWTRLMAERKAKSIFIPTGSLQLVRVLKNFFPRHLFVCGDFSFLPFGDVPVNSKTLRLPGSLFSCVNAPIVSGRDSVTGSKKDFPTYILPSTQKCDVFFQTDFDALADIYETELGNAKAEVRTSGEFLRKHARSEDLTATTTTSGYNPMLDDFENVSFLLGSKF